MQQRSSAQPLQKPDGILAVIADGASLAMVRPLVLLLPIAFDIVLWLGASIHLTGLSDALVRAVQDSGSTDTVALESAQSVATWNALQTATLFVPSLLSSARDIEVFGDPVIDPLNVASVGAGLLMLVALLIGSMLLLALFSVPLADAMSGRTRSVSLKLRAILLAWKRLTILVGLAIAAFLGVLIPVGIVTAILMALGVNLLPLVTLVASVAVLAAVLFTWFTPEAVVVSELGPIPAVRASFAVVRAFPWPSLGFVIVTSLLLAGISEIWYVLVNSAGGLAIGIVGNAFVSVGITLASMRFYRDRYAFVTALRGGPSAPAGPV